MIMSADEARNIVYEEHEDYRTIKKNIDGITRWDICYEGVYEHVPTNKLYSVYWQEGSTEVQDNRAFEYETNVEFVEVEPKEVVKIIYVEKGK